ncbi:SurA N-terminal domain-containing protein [Advenella sp. RU8]|uniref:SurA N-terminal domain-containing protein n=1 Tax=Advenella sp. RU8 TaxID=3399575 RepID=UPI003AAE86BD
MFEFIRKHQRIVLAMLIILVVPSFVFFGVADYQSFVSNDVKLAAIRDTNITQEQFNQSWRARLDQMRMESGANFDVSKVDTPANRQAWLNQLIDTQVLQQEMIDGHFNATDNMVRNAIGSNPQFHENGVYSPQKYNEFLAANGIKDIEYEAYVRQNLAFAHVLEPIAQSVSVPGKTLELLQLAMVQERTVSLKEFEASTFLQDVTVTDEDIKQWYEKNSKTLEVPRYVDVQYIILNQDAALKSVPEVSEADIESYYKSNIGKYTKQERREVNHIQVMIPASADAAAEAEILKKAQDVAAQAKADPAKFSALAKQYSDDVGTKNLDGSLGLLAKGDIPVLDEAIFSLTQPGVTDPVKVGNSYHIIQVVKIDEGAVQPLSAIKNDVLEEIRLQLASEKFAELATGLTQQVNDDRSSLQGVVDSLQLELKTVNGVARDQLLTDKQVSDNAASASADAKYFESPRVREVLFSDEVLKQKLNSGVIEISPSELLVVRVAQEVPATIPALDTVKTEVEAILKNEKALEQAKLAGEEELKMLQENGVATSTGFGPETVISRMMSNQLPQTMLNTIMAAPTDKLPSFVGTTTPNGYVIAQVEKVSEGNPEMKMLFTQFLQPGLESGVALEVAKGVTNVLRANHEVQVFPDAEKVIVGE